MYGICKRWFKSKIMGHFRIVTRPSRKINKASLFMTCVLYALIRCWQKKIFRTYLFIHSVVSLPDFHMQTHCSGQSALEWVFWIIQDDIKSSMNIKGWSFSPIIFMMFWRRRRKMWFQGLLLSSCWWENLQREMEQQEDDGGGVGHIAVEEVPVVFWKAK